MIGLLYCNCPAIRIILYPRSVQLTVVISAFSRNSSGFRIKLACQSMPLSIFKICIVDQNTGRRVKPEQSVLFPFFPAACFLHNPIVIDHIKAVKLAIFIGIHRQVLIRAGLHSSGKWLPIITPHHYTIRIDAGFLIHGWKAAVQGIEILICQQVKRQQEKYGFDANGRNPAQRTHRGKKPLVHNRNYDKNKQTYCNRRNPFYQTGMRAGIHDLCRSFRIIVNFNFIADGIVVF